MNHKPFISTEINPTGWDNGLSQDYCKAFGQWLASRPGARQQVKEMFEADAQLAKQVPMTDEQISEISSRLEQQGDTLRQFARAIEAHHDISSKGEKP